jgi:MoaA/NifB/PqqE/SkfB family radical SAM enzyme
MNKAIKSETPTFDKEKYNTQRIVLAESAPLLTARSIQFNVTEYCNFSCFYCVQPMLQKSKHKSRSLQWETFKKYADNIFVTESGGGVRVCLSGYGEPLINPLLADMIAYIKQATAAAIIEILTNGSLLVPELADKLLDSGLNKIKISLQGINEKQYFENCGARMDFENFLNQMQYFYEQSRGKCEIYMKAIDVMFSSEEEREEFYKMFSPLCDSINIEGLLPTNALDQENSSYNYSHRLGFQVGSDDSICPVPFFAANVDIDGSVYGCCCNASDRDPENIWKSPCIGNLNEQSFSDIWNGREHLELLKSLLNHTPIGVCEKCILPKYYLSPSDVMNGSEAQIIQRIELIEKKNQDESH